MVRFVLCLDLCINSSIFSFSLITHRALIGKPVSLYKVEGGYFLSIESTVFIPLDVSKVKAKITRMRNNEFKPNEKRPCVSQKQSKERA
jgi:hypothetical protein